MIGDGVRQAEVSRLECGRVGLPRRQRLTRIAAALDLSVGELLVSAGWAGADVAFGGPDPAGVAPPPSTPTSPATMATPLEEPGADRIVHLQPLWAAIERSRVLQQRTAQLLEDSAALALRWQDGESRRHRLPTR